MNKNLLIIEPAYTGHHFALYLRLIIKATEGNFNLYLITTYNATNHPSYKIVETESKVNLKVFFIDELKESNKINSYSLLIRQIKLLSLLVLAKFLTKIPLKLPMDPVLKKLKQKIF